MRVCVRNKLAREKCEVIADLVAEYYGVAIGALSMKDRSKKLAQIRLVLMFLCRQRGCGEKVIGEFLNRHPSTVNHAYHRVVSRLFDDDVMRNDILDLELELDKLYGELPEE